MLEPVKLFCSKCSFIGPILKPLSGIYLSSFNPVEQPCKINDPKKKNLSENGPLDSVYTLHQN